MTPAASGRWRTMAVALATALLGLLAGCGLNEPPPPTPVPQDEARELGIAVPAYVDPTDATYWQSIIEAPPQLRDVIVNPNNGPGAEASEQHVQLIRTLRDAGVRVLGYVMTGWGVRDQAEVTQDIDRWREWYGVDSIFLDEAASVSEEVGTYAEYAATIHQSGGVAVLNPGIVPDRGYFEFADAIVTFEDPLDAYAKIKQPPEWLRTETRTEVWHIVSGAPQDQLAEVVSRARQQGAEEIFVTDDVEPNPYDSLPSYWSAKRNAVGE
jgi:hypothetical protein